MFNSTIKQNKFPIIQLPIKIGKPVENPIQSIHINNGSKNVTVMKIDKLFLPTPRQAKKHQHYCFQ